MDEKRTVLIISPGAEPTPDISVALSEMGLSVETKPRLTSGLRALRDDRTLIILDDGGQGHTGNTLKEIKAYHPEAFVIMIASNGHTQAETQSPDAAIREGAYCLLHKPLDIDALKTVSMRAFNEMGIRQELRALKASREAPETPPYLISESPLMLKVINDIEKAAKNDKPVLISGEHGTGKGLAARLIHEKSKRKENPFFSLSGSENSLLTGLVNRFNGGTLHIEELAALDAGLEKKLLWLVKTGELIAEKENEESLKVDARIVFGTTGRKSESSLLRLLHSPEIKIPPLRERREDIIPLCRHFLDEASRLFETVPKRLSKGAEKFILGYEWPGNVKELKEAIKRACALPKGEIIERDDIMRSKGLIHYSIREFLEDKLKRYIKEISMLETSNLHESVTTEVEKALIEIVMKENGGNQLRTSKTLGMNRNTLRAKIKKYKIKAGA